jgi:hypothetical protein
MRGRAAGGRLCRRTQGAETEIYTFKSKQPMNCSTSTTRRREWKPAVRILMQNKKIGDIDLNPKYVCRKEGWWCWGVIAGVGGYFTVRIMTAIVEAY